MAVVSTRTAQGATGHPLTGQPSYGQGIAGHECFELETSGDKIPVNGYACTMDEQGRDKWSGMNGHGVDENGLSAADPGRCVCCPYGYHIDREFLGSLVRSSERNGANLQQLRKMHQRKLRHRQTMESLLMQSIPSVDFNHPEPVTPTVSDATENDVSLTEEMSMNRDGNTASGILSELDETIAEALRAIDELMNSKTKPVNYLLDNGFGSYSSDTGNTSIVSSIPSNSSAPLKSLPELIPSYPATEVPVVADSSSPSIQDGKRGEELEKETPGIEKNRPTFTKAKPPPLYPKPLISSRIVNQSQIKPQLNSYKTASEISSLDVDPVPSLSNSTCDRGFPQTNEEVNPAKDDTWKNHRTFPTFPVVLPAKDTMVTRPWDDLSSSSDLTKALAVLLPIDGSAVVGGVGAGAGGTEALVRLRQYIVSSLRQMRLLEQQVKTIPVMHVRLSVLKEEKKLLRLQLLSLQSGLPSAVSARPTGGDLEDGIATPSLAPPPTFADPCSPGAGSGPCSLCGGSFPTERHPPKSAISRQSSATKLRSPMEMSNFKNVRRLQQQQRQPEDSCRDDNNQLSAEPRSNKRQLCKSVSLNPHLLYDRAINPTQPQKPTDSPSQNIIGSPTTLVANNSSFRRRPDVPLKRGLSLNEDGARSVCYRSRELQERVASETNLIRNRWNAKSLEKIAGFRSGPGQESLKATYFNEPVKIRKVSLARNTYATTTTTTAATTETATATTTAATTAATAVSLLKPPPPHRQSFNAGIQCELLSTKIPTVKTTTCPQCRFVINPKKPMSRDVSRVCDAVNSISSATINPRSQGQTPDVIVTHRQTGLPGSGLPETVERTESGRDANEHRMDDSFSSKLDSVDSRLKVESKEVGCMTEEDLYTAIKSETFTSTDGGMFHPESKNVGCRTDVVTLDRVATREASIFTEVLMRDLKEVWCMADLNLSQVVTRDAGSLTDQELFKGSSKEIGCMVDLNLGQVTTCDASSFTEQRLFEGSSKEVGCSTDVILSQVVTCEASSLADEGLLQRSSKEVGCVTDVSVDQVATRDASSFTESDMFKGNSKDVGCLSEITQVMTCDASCVTDEKLFKGGSKDVGCFTDVLLTNVVTLDASSFTEREMFPQNSRDVGCITDANLSQVVTHDASSFTDKKLFKVGSKDTDCLTDVNLSQVATVDVSSFTEKELFKVSSKDIGCLTDMKLSQVVTVDVSSFTEKELFKVSSKDIDCLTDMKLSQVVTGDVSSFTEKELFTVSSKDIGCLTDMNLSHVITHDASSFTEKELFKGYSQEVGCLTDVPINDVTTQDAWSLTERAMFKGYSKDVGCLTDVPINDVTTQDAWSLTERAMFKGYSKDVGCLTTLGPNKLPTRDAICFTEKEMLREDTREVSCMTDHINTLTSDAGCNTEVSSCEKSSQAPFSSQSSQTAANEHSLILTGLDGNFNTENSAANTTGHCDACRVKRSTHEIGCNTDSMFPADDHNLTRVLPDSVLQQSLSDGVEITIAEVNNNVNQIISLKDITKSRSENESVVNDALLNNVENSSVTITYLDPTERVGNAEIVSDATSDLQTSRSQSTATKAAVEGGSQGGLSREKSRRVSLVTDGGEEEVERRSELSRDNISKIMENPSSTSSLEKEALTERPSLHLGESFFRNEKLNSALKTYSTWLQDSTEVNTKQLNGSLKVIQQEWFSVSSQKTSSSVHVKQLTDAFAKVSPDIIRHVVNMVDTNENTALHYSVSHRNFDLILFLLSTDICDVNRRNRAGCTAVMLASLVTLETDEQRATMRRLIEASDVNVTAALTGQTALMLAASRDHRETVRMLLEAKADPNVQDLDGSTALMCASEHGYISVVRILLAHPGCDPSLCDNEGSTALSVAMEAGHRDIGVLIYAHINFRKQTSQVVGRRHERKGSASNQKHRP